MKICFFREFAVVGRHSKNVALKKNKLDLAKTKLYQRFGVKILMIAKQGGTDPSSNKDLHRVLKEAHAIKLPKENIERMLKKASDASTNSYSSLLYEVFGYGSVGLIITSLTDNSNRTVKEIKAIANKSDVKMANTGSVLYSFEQKGVINIPSTYNEDDIIEAALDNGIDDIQFIDSIPDFNDSDNDSTDESNSRTIKKLIVTSPSNLNKLQDSLEIRLNYSNLIGSLEYIPVDTVEVSKEDYDKNLALIDQFNSLDDVDKIYHNMKPYK